MLTQADLTNYCLSKTGTTEEFPFDFVTPVFKVKNKMFALIGVGDPVSINLKCDPNHALFLRSTYPAVREGYHMSKKHWNTVTIDGTIPDDEILHMIDLSYDLVVKGLSKKDREDLQKA